MKFQTVTTINTKMRPNTFKSLPQGILIQVLPGFLQVDRFLYIKHPACAC
jgi:hypothetical protein